MTNNNETAEPRTLTIALSIDEIFKQVEAESAWMAHMIIDKVTPPKFITEDNRAILSIKARTAYLHLCSGLLGYMQDCDFGSFDTGIAKLTLNLPADLPSKYEEVLMHHAEIAMVCDIMQDCYTGSIKAEIYGRKKDYTMTRMRELLATSRGRRLNWA
ncbi:MAG: hypothetical protein LKF31_07865 [Muribaculaceae bacterium]|jgi:hypothetical protein|nr:hypothetical protein [Muribaculaceae bacterium]